ncbi:MAG: hypothetical protein K9W44_00360 [Candidatus Lokiarchaeota archaeon]|nr:hypothetical protein [Candidatus Harpocratesius repetitus]
MGKATIKLVLDDGGAYSLKNLQLLDQHGAVGMIRATKNIKKHNLVKLSSSILINRDFISSSRSNDELHELYGLRTCNERQFSHNTLFYNASRVNIRRIAEVAKHRYMILCLDLLKTIACHKLDRKDLFQHSTAFSQIRSGYKAQMLRMTLYLQGYKLLVHETTQNIRQK